MRPTPTLFVALAALALTACAGARAASVPAPEVPTGREQAVIDSLRYPYTEADVSFMQGMIQHHAQAILISRWAPTHGASAEVQRLTARIINAQTDEITLMRNWLLDRRRPAPMVDSAGTLTLPPELAEHAMHHGDHSMMPGMLNAEQLATLDATRGEEFDVTFLQSMIRHHRGAVTMVNELLASHGAGQDETVFKFAADVAVDQTTEIRRMLQMLLELGGIPPA